MSTTARKLVAVAIVAVAAGTLALAFIPGLSFNPIANLQYLIGYSSGWQESKHAVYLLEVNPQDTDPNEWLNHDIHHGCSLIYFPARSLEDAQKGVPPDRNFFDEAINRDTSARPVGLICAFSGPGFVIGAVRSERSLPYKLGFNRAVACAVGKRAREVDACPPV